jgi:lysophospholipase L1-like esterase
MAGATPRPAFAGGGAVTATAASLAVPAGAFVRGVVWGGVPGVAYPRADPADAARLPADTWAMASVPAGVRLELVGDADGVRLDVETTTDDLGYRGAAAGTTFTALVGDELLDEVPAERGRATVELRFHGRSEMDRDAPVVVHLPEGMKPVVHTIAAVGGTLAPAPAGPRWLCYGDSIAEGWVASGPAWSWPARTARRHRLDLVNLGYAGAARGEIPSAEQIAALGGRGADVISLSHGTNCWSRTPHSAAMVRAGLDAFLDIVRQGHPDTPVVVVSPVVRPDAEAAANRLGATLADLRSAIEDVVTARAARDARLSLVPGAALLRPDQLPDGIHPGDEGHAALADTIGPLVAAAAAGGG